MRFRELDTVKVVRFPGLLPYVADRRGIITKCNKSVFGETYWIQWDDGKDTLMAGNMLVKARFSD